MIQPLGCSENTFAGSSADLTEIALQAFRTAVATLNKETVEKTILYTLTLVDAEGLRAPPTWRTDVVSVHGECGCSKLR
jgi:hypothetical protein